MKNLILTSAFLAALASAASAQSDGWNRVQNDASATGGSPITGGGSSSSSGSSESDAARLVDAAKATQDAIRKSVLADAFKIDFRARLSGIMKKAGCRANQEAGAVAEGAPFFCAAAGPQAVLTAMDEIAKLNVELDKTVKADGAKTLSEVYAERAKELTAEIDSSGLAQADKTAFLNRLKTFQASLVRDGKNGGVAAGKTPSLSVEEARTQFAALAADVKEAISLAAKGQTLMQEYTAQSKALHGDIEKSVLAASFKNDFEKQLAAIDREVCPQSSKIGGSAAGAKGGVCGPVAAEAGLESLKDLRDAFAEAVKTDGGKTLAEIYGPKVDALKEAAKGARIDADDMATLNKRFETFTSALSGKGAPLGETVSKIGLGGAPTPEKAESDFAALKAEVDAAVKLAATPGRFDATLVANVKKFDEELKASRLNVDLKNEFGGERNTALSSVECLTHSAEAAGAAAGKCAMITFVDILEAEKNLAALAAKLEKAITKDGSKSMSELYANKIERLTDKLDASSVDATDKAKLQARIKTFAADLKDADAAGSMTGAGAGKKRFTAEDAEEAWSQLKDDVAAAIDLSKSKH